MHITLVYPPCAETNLKGYPLGLAYLVGALKQKHNLTVYNYAGRPYHQSLTDLFKNITQTPPDILGISFNSFNRQGAYDIIRKLKKKCPKTLVVLGGVHASTLYQQLFQYFSDLINFIIRSEGENSFLALVDALEQKKDYSQISGLVYKTVGKKIIANPVSDIIKNLDDLPLPDYSYVADEIARTQAAFLITSRGCPVNCIFCSTSSFWGQNVRMYSPERVGREVEYVKSLGAQRIFFYDDTFNLGIDRTLKVCAVLKKMHIEYGISCRVNPVNKEMIAGLVDSGCRHITWGVESLSEEIMLKIDKKITRAQVKQAFDLCAPYANCLTTGAYCCVGIPGENEKTIQESADFFNKNIRSTNGPGASILYVLPGTKLHDQLVQAKKFNPLIWIKSGAVYYYTREQTMRVLNRWRKIINRSGIRIPFTGKNF